MLKIKDNVDLKKLKKYGFEYIKRVDYGTTTNEYIYRNDKEDINVFTDSNEFDNIPRVLYMMNDMSSFQESPMFEFPNILYDLIKADLVEKVEK